MKIRNECKSNINSININLTSECNLICNYCFRRNTQNKQVITDNLSGLKEIIGHSQIKNIIFTGGEPALCNNLKDIIKLMEDKQISVLTNGIKFIPFLRNSNICVSLDGLLKHNLYRQIDEGLYKQILKNIKKYHKHNNVVEIHTVLSDLNYKDLDYSLDLYDLKKSIGLISKLSSENIQLNQDELLYYNQYIKKLISKNKYHYKLTSTIISKNQFYKRYSIDAPFSPFPELNLENNKFYFFNITFPSLKSLEDNYDLLCKESWYMLNKELSYFNDNYLFDPYVELEFLWYKKF